jgi:hypothetical protein
MPVLASLVSPQQLTRFLLPVVCWFKTKGSITPQEAPVLGRISKIEQAHFERFLSLLTDRSAIRGCSNERAATRTVRFGTQGTQYMFGVGKTAAKRLIFIDGYETSLRSLQGNGAVHHAVLKVSPSARLTRRFLDGVLGRPLRLRQVPKLLMLRP